MTITADRTAIDQLLAVLDEGYEGSQKDWSYFVDAGPESGLKNALARVSAEEASRPWAGNSIAAHAHHVLFAFRASAASISGDHSSRDWNESWSVSTVSAPEWEALQRNLGTAFRELRGAIETHAATGAEAIAAVAHLAYHLGAIRQKATAAVQA